MVSGLHFLDFMLVSWYSVETANAQTLKSIMRGAVNQLIDVFAIVKCRIFYNNLSVSCLFWDIVSGWEWNGKTRRDDGL